MNLGLGYEGKPHPTLWYWFWVDCVTWQKWKLGSLSSFLFNSSNPRSFFLYGYYSICSRCFITRASSWVMVPGVPSGERGNSPGDENNRVLALREQRNWQNAVFSEESFEKNHPFTLISHSEMPSVFGTGWSTNSIAWKLAKCKLHAPQKATWIVNILIYLVVNILILFACFYCVQYL